MPSESTRDFPPKIILVSKRPWVPLKHPLTMQAVLPVGCFHILECVEYFLGLGGEF